MAKYSRFDPRNKNRDRNKYRSLNKDIRIREEDGKMHRRSWKNTIDAGYDKELDEWDDDQYERT
jgi:hypothetical protein